MKKKGSQCIIMHKMVSSSGNRLRIKRYRRQRVLLTAVHLLAEIRTVEVVAKVLARFLESYKFRS